MQTKCSCDLWHFCTWAQDMQLHIADTNEPICNCTSCTQVHDCHKTIVVMTRRAHCFHDFHDFLHYASLVSTTFEQFDSHESLMPSYAMLLPWPVEHCLVR